MSLMSAAEAGQSGGASPDTRPPRLRLATAAAGPDGGDTPGSAPGAAAAAEPGPGWPGSTPRLAATGLRATEVRVREVRVVRQASVRTLRAGGPRARPAPAGRGSRARAATFTRMASQTRAAQARARAEERVVAAPAGVTRARAVYARAAAQTRTVSRARTAGPRPGPAGPLRLTRRGRRVVAALATLAVIVAAALLWITMAGSVQASSRGQAPGSPYQGMTQIVVRPGQTLWSIAVTAEPSANPWTVVQQIIQVNALSGPRVDAGQLLWVPRG